MTGAIAITETDFYGGPLDGRHKRLGGDVRPSLRAWAHRQAIGIVEVADVHVLYQESLWEPHDYRLFDCGEGWAMYVSVEVKAADNPAWRYDPSPSYDQIWAEASGEDFGLPLDSPAWPGGDVDTVTQKLWPAVPPFAQEERPRPRRLVLFLARVLNPGFRL